MKLAAIYNVWDGVELLRGSMECMKDSVDLFIIVYQDVSNFNEQFDPSPDFNLTGLNCIVEKYKPIIVSGAINERNKRNFGLTIAKNNGCTHFLHVDCDEYYEDFEATKQQYISSGHKGSVCKLYTYFKHPTYRFETPDGYHVPFIHQLNPDTTAGVKDYPFYVDPTRRINETDVVELKTYMHHFSWVRNDIERKARNSSAKNNIARGTILNDYYSEKLAAEPNGYYVKDFDKKLVVVENKFNIYL